MARKNLLSDLMSDRLTAVNSSPPSPDGTPMEMPATQSARGVVGAIGRSLERMSGDRDLAKALEAKIAAGDTVVEVDVGLIDASFVADRVAQSQPDIADLVIQIREQGQQVPVLLRPHPDGKGRYQIAYGHRRVRALAEIGRPVRALIRPLTDAELVVAQGQENSARKDLSFIERARFAAALEDRGFARDVITAALSVDKTELSRLLAVARAIPALLVEAVGPAPKAGRGRWMAVARLLGGRPVEPLVAAVTSDPAFSMMPSDRRFEFLLRALAPKPPPARRANSKDPAYWADAEGRRIAEIERTAEQMTLRLDETAAPAFGDFVIARLPELYRAFREAADAKET